MAGRDKCCDMAGREVIPIPIDDRSMNLLSIDVRIRKPHI